MSNSDPNLDRVEAALDAMRRALAAARERMGEGLQLTRTQIEILLMLAMQEQTTRDLAARLFLTGSAVTQTIDTLVRRELVERRADSGDRRIIRLRLTASGRKLTDHLRGLRRNHMQALLEKLSAGEVEAMISITHKLTELFNESKVDLRG